MGGNEQTTCVSKGSLVYCWELMWGRGGGGCRASSCVGISSESIERLRENLWLVLWGSDIWQWGRCKIAPRKGFNWMPRLWLVGGPHLKDGSIGWSKQGAQLAARLRGRKNLEWKQNQWGASDRFEDWMTTTMAIRGGQKSVWMFCCPALSGFQSLHQVKLGWVSSLKQSSLACKASKPSAFIWVSHSWERPNPVSCDLDSFPNERLIFFVPLIFCFWQTIRKSNTQLFSLKLQWFHIISPPLHEIWQFSLCVDCPIMHLC